MKRNSRAKSPDRPRADESLPPNVSPLIDICFLLLIYFLVAATLVPRESDLGLGLPTPETTAELRPLIEPMRIQIDRTGAVHAGAGVSLVALDAGPGSRELPLLGGQLEGYSSACRAAGVEPLVMLAPDEGASHQRLVDVLNALAAAGIRRATFEDRLGPDL